MSVKGADGNDISYSTVSNLLKALQSGDIHAIRYCKNYIKGAFAHEMAHQLREEFLIEKNIGQEIASHAVEMLTCGGENLGADLKFEEALKNHRSSYRKDMVASLRLLQEKFCQNKSISYKPQSHTPEELNKAMKSIPKDTRVEVLKKIAKEIINTPSMHLLKLAA